MHCQGDLTITKENAAKYYDLESVTGYLEVYSDFQAPALTSVGRYLEVHADFQAPALTSVGRNLEVYSDFQAPALISVGRYLEVYSDFQAPALTSVGWGLYVHADFQAPALTLVEDEILTQPAQYILDLNWPVLITDNYIRIGCQRHTKNDWAGFSDEQINSMDTKAIKFWRKHKKEILTKAGVSS